MGERDFYYAIIHRPRDCVYGWLDRCGSRGRGKERDGQYGTAIVKRSRDRGGFGLDNEPPCKDLVEVGGRSQIVKP